jgi:hypothetical protein
MLSRVSSLFGGGEFDPRAGIVALATAKQEKGAMSRDVFALTSSVVQRWKIAPGGGEQVCSHLMPIQTNILICFF